MKKPFIALTLAAAAVAIIIGLSACAKEPAGDISGTQTATVTITQETQATAEPTEQLVGGDRDEHGCIGSAGYTWCEAKQKCIRLWEEPCDTPALPGDTPVTSSTIDEIGIKAAFASKYDKTVDEITLLDPQITSNFARGGVSFSPEPGDSGMFMAVKKDGRWELAFDGNGQADCNSLEEYGFPSAMLEGICY